MDSNLNNSNLEQNKNVNKNTTIITTTKQPIINPTTNSNITKQPIINPTKNPSTISTKQSTKNNKKRLFIISKKKITTMLDKLTFTKILLIWVSSVLFFGFVYYAFSSKYAYLYYSVKSTTVTSLLDSVYFSFVAATTTGLGDVVPFGYFKLIVIVEVVLGLLLLAVVTSKLVSIKQDYILEELYDISFYELLNRIRSSLLLFRQNLGDIQTSIEDGNRKRIKDLDHYLSSFDGVLRDISSIIIKRHKKIFTKELNPVDSELIFNSIFSSYQKFYELIIFLDEQNIAWRKNSIVNLLKSTISTTRLLFSTLVASKKLPKNTTSDLSKKTIILLNDIESKADEIIEPKKSLQQQKKLEVY